MVDVENSLRGPKPLLKAHNQRRRWRILRRKQQQLMRPDTHDDTKNHRNALLWPITDWPNPQPLQPTPPNNSLLFPLHPQCPCRTYICNQLHSLSRYPSFPNTHPPPYASSHPLLCVPERAGEEADATARSQGNAGSWYGGNQSRGSSGYRSRRGGRRRRGSGSARLPTVTQMLDGGAVWV